MFDALSSAAVAYAKANGSYNSRLAALRRIYKGKPGYETDFDTKLQEELVADIIGDHLFTDEDFARQLAAEDRNLFQKIFDEVKHLVKMATPGSKEARQLEKLKHTFEKVWREKNTAQQPDGDVKYSIVALDNGNVYVKASRNVITGNTLSERRQNITEFFNVLLEGQSSLDIQTIEGDVLTITKSETADKARDNYREVNGKRVKLSDDEFAVKLHVESYIDEIAEASRRISQPNRRAYFEDSDGQYYEITLSIGHNGFVATVYNMGKVKESVLPSAKTIAVVDSKALGKTPSILTLSKSDQNVNPQMTQSEDTGGAVAAGSNVYGADVALDPAQDVQAEADGSGRVNLAQKATAERALDMDNCEM